MAIRQYIGARYVPKFMGEYDATQVYEALCVVDNGLGTSYIAKIPTPAGTPLTNTTYWAIYGTSSGAIINLQNQIDTINDVTIPAITTDVGDLDDLETTDKDSLVDALNEVLSKTLYGTKERIVCVGDSYPENGNTFPRVAAMLPTDKYEVLGYAGGGASFSKTDQSGYTSYKSILESETIPEPNTIDRIIIMGGYNEINITTNIVAGVDGTVSYLQTRFPNATIEYMPVGRNKSATYNKTVQLYDDMAINELKRKGCIVHDNAKWILSSAEMMSSDSVHPSTEGYTELVKYLYDVIVNKCLNVVNSFEIPNIGAAGGLPFTISGHLWYNQFNDRCCVTSTDLSITKASGTGRWTIASGGRASFLDTPNFFINNDATVSAPVNADFPFRQTNSLGSMYLKVQSIQNTSAFNVCNFGNAQQCVGVNEADDASGVTTMSSEFRMEFSLSDQFPKYPLSWINY